MSQELERVYTIPLGKALISQSQHRAVRAINMIKEFDRHHMKVEIIKIDEELAHKIWARGVRSPPRKIKVRMSKTDGKGQDFSPLVEPITRFAKGIILIGRDAPVIEKVCAKAIEHHALERICANSLESAVEQASQQAKAGDIVLLSPACASFDMFKDYKHRARIFEQAVQDLVHQASSTSNDSLRASV